jgi:hypothetical protein
MSLLSLFMRSLDESTIRLFDGDIVEYGSEKHIQDIEKMIDELKHVKASLRSGPDRLKFRKESHRLQGAIEALRFLSSNAKRWNRKKSLLAEGGLKLPPDKRHLLANLTPSVVGSAVKVYEDVIKKWNSYLSNIGEKEVRALRPTGSVSYYSQDISDNADISYGDIDYLVEIPSDFSGAGESDRRKADRDQHRKYEDLFVNFLKSYPPETVDVESTLSGGTPFMVMIRLPDKTLVQVDTVVTFPRYADWMTGRYTPERGIKGYTIGNLYKALGDYLVMSIGTDGVIVRSKMGERVPGKFSRSRGVETENITTSIRTFLSDIAKYLIGESEITEDQMLIDNPGVNPENVTISSLAKGIVGLARTLENHGVYNASEMLQSVLSNYRESLAKNIESKRSKGIDDMSYRKLLDLNSSVIKTVASEFGI